MVKRIMRLMPLLLIPAVMLIMTAVCTAAGSDGLTASVRTAAPGDTFNVSIVIPSMADADTASLMVEFDPDVFTVEEWKPVLSAKSTEIYNSGTDFFSVASAGVERNISLGKGMTLTAKMKVRSGAKSGSYSFTLKKHSLSYYDDNTGELHELWAKPETVSINVGVASEDSGIGVSKRSLDRGEVFTVSIYVPPLEKADTAEIRVEFEPSIFEVRSWEPGITGAVTGNGSGFFSLAAANAGRSIDLTKGLTINAKLAVLSTAATGSHKIRLTKSSMSYYNTETDEVVEMWAPNNTEAVVVINSPYSTTTTTTTPKPITTTSHFPWVTNVTPSSVTTRVTTATVTSIITGAPSDVTSRFYPDDTITEPADTTKPISTSASGRETTWITDNNNGQIKLAVDSKLKGLPKSKLSIGTKYEFFPTSTVITLTNTDKAENCSAEALKALGLSDHPAYSFDISLYSMSSGSPVQLVTDKGYIEFLMPVPNNLLINGAQLSVYHVEKGVPEAVKSKVEYTNNEYKIRFTASGFSPYVIVDTTKGHTVKTAPSTDNVTPSNGPVIPSDGALNPNTGVAAAIAIPCALTGCVFLARNSRRRKRARRAIDDNDENEKKKK